MRNAILGVLRIFLILHLYNFQSRVPVLGKSMLETLCSNSDLSQELEVALYTESDSMKFQLSFFIDRNYTKTNLLSIKETRDIWTDFHLGDNGGGIETSRVAVILIHQNESSFTNSMNKANQLERSSIEMSDWSTYFLVWPKILHDEAEVNFTIQTSLTLQQSPLDISSNTFFVFPYYRATPRSGGGGNRRPMGRDPWSEQVKEPQVDVVIWEMYSIRHLYIKRKLDPNKILDWRYLSNKLGRRRNFQQLKIKAVAANDPIHTSEVKFGREEDGSPRFDGGLSVFILWFLRDKLNFTDQAMEGIVQRFNKTEPISDSAQLVAKGEADLCITQTPMERVLLENNLTFLQPTIFTGYYIVRAFFVQPEANSYRDIYLSPFKPDLWFTMFMTWILILITLEVIGFTKRFMLTQFEEEDDPLDHEILKENLIWAIGAICQQGWHMQPTSFSLRIIFLVGYFTGLICFVAFSAVIVSILSVERAGITSSEQLMDGSFRIYLNPANTPEPFQALPAFEKQYKKYGRDAYMHERGSFTTIQRSKSVFLTYPDIFYVEAKMNNSYDDQKICNTFSSLPVNRVSTPSGMLVQKGSEFKEFFNHGLLVMRERGFGYRFYEMYTKSTIVSCLNKEESGNKEPLGIRDVFTAYMVLMLGYLASFGILTLEILFKRSKSFEYPFLM